MDQYSLFVLLSPFGCAISIATAIYCWQRRSAHAARPLAIAMVAITAYLLSNTLELVNPTPGGTLFFAQLNYVWIGILTVNWLAFALAFSNRENWLASPFFRLLWLIPGITVVLIFTNSFHHLIWQDYTFVPVTNGYLHMQVAVYGGWFWVFWLQAYFLILGGAILMISASFTPRSQFRAQVRLTVIAALLPVTVNLVYVLHLIPGLVKDYSPLGYAFSGILLAISVYRYHLLDLSPIARGVLIDNMADAMLTLDLARRLVDYNPAAQRIFAATQIPAPQMGEPFTLFDPNLEQMAPGSESDLLRAEIVLTQRGEEGYYDLQIRRLRDRYNAGVIGYLVLLHAVTEHKKLLQTVRKMAEEDALTGVLNRSCFVELANLEIARSQITRQGFTILMVDIDHFKQVNDTVGHVGGDQLLQSFALRLRGALRATDLIGRMGGDEFIVLLPGTGQKGAHCLAERLCQKISNRPLDTDDYGSFPITISVGVAEFADASADTLESAIINADKGLYRAKALGRNRACAYDPTLELKSN